MEAYVLHFLSEVKAPKMFVAGMFISFAVFQLTVPDNWKPQFR